MSRGGERYSAALGLDALNVFNHPTFASVTNEIGNDINSTQFGRVTQQATMPRRLQLRLEINF